MARAKSKKKTEKIIPVATQYGRGKIQVSYYSSTTGKVLSPSELSGRFKATAPKLRTV